MKKRSFLFLSAGTGVLVVALMAPRYFRAKVREKLPSWAKVTGQIDVSPLGATLHGVDVDRGWVKGHIDEVFVSRDQTTIRVKGGSLTVDFDKKPKDESKDGPKRTLTATGFHVVLTKDSAVATLEGASWDGVQGCFEQGSLTHPKGTLQVTKGCLSRKGEDTFTAKHVATHIETLPEVPGIQLRDVNVSIEGVEAKRTADDAFDVKAENFSAGPLSGTGVHVTKSTAFASTLTVQHPWLSANPSTFKQVGVDWTPTFAGKAYVQLSNGKQVEVHFDYAAQSMEGKASCADWQGALPDGIKEGPLKGLTYTGELGFSVALKPTPKLALDAKCKVVCDAFPKLRQRFTYTAYKSDGMPFERTTGPGTPDWLTLAGMGPMPMAVVNLEDYAFPWHRGYLSDAFQNSLLDNVAKGRFFRGGSTITQQTAKNLWLSREKTFGRKIAELFLAQALESCMSKDDILETYLNIIEFGPDIYGLKAGADHWFGKSPEALTPTEAFWLASILPAPRKATKPSEDDLKRIERLMKSLASQGRIPDLAEDGSGASEPLNLSEWQQNR